MPARSSGRSDTPPDDFDYLDDSYDVDDEDNEAEMNCGQLADGSCGLVGTEWCDWSCPFSDELRVPKRRARRGR